MLPLALPLKSLPPRSAAFRSKLPAGGTGAGIESWYACNEGSRSLIKSGWFFDTTEAVLGCNWKLSRVIEAGSDLHWLSTLRPEFGLCNATIVRVSGSQTREPNFWRKVHRMKRNVRLAIVSMLITAPSWLLAQERGGDYNHASVGIFADDLNFSPTTPNINFVGFGARTAFNVGRHTQIEGEMSYDFQRSFTTSCNGNCLPGVTFVTTRVRPLTGLFGPKFETPGRVKFFVTGKVGFVRFTESSAAVTLGNFGNAVAGVGGPGTHLAMYPGAGVEGFWGPFGLRLEAGDEIYLNNGTFHDLRVTFGPQFRF